ncbi:hypothetical protein SAMD00019534_069320 [Acytostelium subglobosum LB1]|uniref:hypothetical protein n=1 Tax=Acytostelium subglobosum LB1 TaxID=1410327 RepID=UPI0006451DEB|nr:hypothetical protein SAMD00019534_069320 [Acytostelium subglobosum LB1]GAM23757.1 hypothetical protein SAMD00019534_069320 [Acytostelium subglobosum LB1]|eukprot:XP_012753498.1 hypothetical protein SAMD00019534_069320 [Acytostelium subglobosum LB1]
MQCDHPNELGFIPKSVAMRLMKTHESIKQQRKQKQQRKDNPNAAASVDGDQQQSDTIIDYETHLENEAKRNFEKFRSQSSGAKKIGEKEICQRCHMLKHYGKVAPIKIPIEDFKNKLAAIKDMNCVVIKVVDIMDFHGTFIPDFRRIIGNNPVVLVGNKMDVLPADIHKNRIEDWLRHECKLHGMVVSHVKLLSSASRDGLASFIVELEQLRRGRDVFVVGCSNVGKSTFINSLVDEYKQKVVFTQDGQQGDDEATAAAKEKPTVMDRATTSIFPGTTLNIISVPLWHNASLFDTPGIDNPHQIIKLLRPDELKMVIPTKRIKPTVVHMIGGKSLYLGGLARIDYDGGLATFTIYTSTHLPLHLCRTDKADDLLTRQRGKMLSPPLGDAERLAEESIQLSQAKRFTIIPEKVDFRHTCTDIIISGLGWVAVKSLSKTITPMRVIVHTPTNIDVSIRDPLVPYTTTYNTL